MPIFVPDIFKEMRRNKNVKTERFLRNVHAGHSKVFKKDVATIKLNVPPADASKEPDDADGKASSEIQLKNPQKVTIFVDDDSWRELKVFCARQKIRITEQAGKIIKIWTAANAAQ